MFWGTRATNFSIYTTKMEGAGSTMNACYALEPTRMKTRWQVCRVPMFSRRGCAGLRKKGFVTLAVDVCQAEK